MDRDEKVKGMLRAMVDLMAEDPDVKERFSEYFE